MTDPGERASTRTDDAPDPDDPRKPTSPTDLTSPSWKYALRTTITKFSADSCTDLAAGLTYRTVFALFPGLLALVSILSLFGHSGAMDSVLDDAAKVVPADTWQSLRPALETVLSVPAPGWGLVIGLVVALWSASSYIKAFGRAMNTINEVPEGRSAVKLTAQMYLLTVVILALIAVGLLVLALSGPVAQVVGEAIGLGAATITIWSIVKWFVLALIVVVVVALLYYATPNVRQPRLRWISPGAITAILVGTLATVAFFFYVANFGNYNKTYGTLAGVIVLLLWVYILNAILLFGAELDNSLERARELQAGMPAEHSTQLPARDTRASDKRAEKQDRDLERAHALRQSRGQSQDSADQTEPLPS